MSNTFCNSNGISVPIIFLAFGNPLLDISVVLEPSDNILDQHNLKQDDEIEISKEKLTSILQDISKLPNKIRYVPGGSAQNTTRILQWLLGVSNSTSYIGSVGRDDQGKLLEARNTDDGVYTKYIVHDDKPTGVCVAFINGPHRSLAAHLGAAVDFRLEHLEECQQLINCLDNLRIVYVEGFFITDRLEIVENILKYCKQHKKLFVFNLNSEYLMHSYGDHMKHFALECDILFGNANQYLTLAELLDMDVEKTNKNIALCLNKKSTSDNKIVVVTDGSNPVICVSGDQVVDSYEVPKLPMDRILDTTGAGDTFAAGFLAGIIKDKDLKTCIAWGCWTSREIIQLIGCQAPIISPKEILNVSP